MKKFYETAELNVFMFETKDVIVASGMESVSTTYFKEDHETEML